MKWIEKITMINNRLCIFLLGCLLASGCSYAGNKQYQNNKRPSSLLVPLTPPVSAPVAVHVSTPVVESRPVSVVAIQSPPQEVVTEKKMGHKKIEFEEGFKKMKWGDIPSKKMKRIEQDTHDKELTAYLIENDLPRVFELHSGMVVYYFKNNHFFRFEVLWQPSEPEYQALKNKIIEELGDAEEVTVLGSYRWEMPERHLAILFSNVNANKASSAGYLMSLVVEKLET